MNEQWTHITRDGKYHGLILRTLNNDSIVVLLAGREIGSDFIRICSEADFNKDFTPLSDKFAELKEAHKNGARIQCKGFGNTTWINTFVPDWNTKRKYRIDPEWLKEQEEAKRLYAWDVFNKGYWFRYSRYATQAKIQELYPIELGFRHVRGAEFIPPRDAT